jgi:hypothetical protein
MDAKAIPDVGLGGDGDEVDAIQNVEAHFGVKLDYGDAPNWRTAGDVYAALLKALPAEPAAKPDVGARFAKILCDESGVDPKTICPESLLLGKANHPALYWFFIAIVVAVAGAAGVLFH